MYWSGETGNSLVFKPEGCTLIWHMEQPKEWVHPKRHGKNEKGQMKLKRNAGVALLVACGLWHGSEKWTLWHKYQHWSFSASFMRMQATTPSWQAATGMVPPAHLWPSLSDHTQVRSWPSPIQLVQQAAPKSINDKSHDNHKSNTCKTT